MKTLGLSLVVFVATALAAVAASNYSITWVKTIPHWNGSDSKTITVRIAALKPVLLGTTSTWVRPGVPALGAGYQNVDAPVRNIAEGEHEYDVVLIPPGRGYILKGCRISIWEKFVPGTHPLQLINRLDSYEEGDVSRM